MTDLDTSVASAPANPAPERRRRPMVRAAAIVVVLVGVGLVADLALGSKVGSTTVKHGDSSVTAPHGWSQVQPGTGYELALQGPGGAILAVHEADNPQQLTAESLKAGVTDGTITDRRLTGQTMTIISTPAGPGVQIQKKAISFTVTTIEIPTTHHIWTILEGPGTDPQAVADMPKVFASLKLKA